MTSSKIPRKILVAVAEGGLSNGALVFASRLAAEAGAELVLLHGLAVPTLLGLRLKDSETEALTSERKARLSGEVDALAARLDVKGFDTRRLTEQLRVIAGHPAKVVIEHARAMGADLIVLGTSGKSKELDFGGVARAVLSQANCPVLIVPSEPRPVKRILVPVDLSPASLAALAVARDWAALFKARLLAIHCFSVPELVAYGIPEAPLAPIDFGLDDLRAAAKERFEREMREFDWAGVPWDARLYDDSPEETILEIQAKHDLLVMSTHGHTGIAAALLGSVAYNVLRRLQTPALACPIRD